MNLDFAAEELKRSLRWQDIAVSKNREICVRIPNDQITGPNRTISGLTFVKDTITLVDQAFNDIPIRFDIYNGINVHSYRVLNGNLHSLNDLPARVCIVGDQKNGTLIKQRWYHNGLKHRINGPAEITITGYQTSDEHPDGGKLPDGYQTQSWCGMTQNWYINGLRAVWPYPSHIQYGKGYWVRQIEPPYHFIPELIGIAVMAESFEAFFTNDFSDHLKFETLYVNGLGETYDKENVLTQRAGVPIVKWMQLNSFDLDLYLPKPVNQAILTDFQKWFAECILGTLDFHFGPMLHRSDDQMILLVKVDEIRKSLV